MNTLNIPGLKGLTAGNVYCIGRNYAAHAKELGNAIPDEPLLFTKPSVSLTTDGKILIPPFVHNPHYEVEVVVAIGTKGKNIPKEQAWSHTAGIGLGIDVTARDLQDALKKEGKPWFIAKGLDTFAPISPFLPANALNLDEPIHFFLDINGQRRQTGDTSLMLFPIPRLISEISRYVTLLPGDLLFTGTPEGVGPLNDGDRLYAKCYHGQIALNATVSFL
ncbi:fumarylacetoacetate hydrolase family protein [Balneolaceae bacterium ANBcel3]|nr:fumarylacetoacetate hydrolase family protein [Balneolaceae bacterium ANBcel3]